MNELLRDFLTESSEQLELVGAQLAQLGSDRPNARIVANVSRLIHTLKGASGILNLPQLERIVDAAEALVLRLRDGETRDVDASPLLMSTVDRIRSVIVNLAAEQGLRDAAHGASLVAPRKAASPVEMITPLTLGGQTSAKVEPLSNDELCRSLVVTEPLLSSRPSEKDYCPYGLDRAFAAMTRIGVAVSLRSAPGQGSAFTIQSPSKLAIAPAVIIVAAGARMAVLRHAVVRIFEIAQADKTLVANAGSVIEMPEGRLPLARLDLVATGKAASTDPRLVIHIKEGYVALAVLVDEIVGFQDIVLEPLPLPLRNLSLYSGVAALVDGTAVMVLNPAGLAAALRAPARRRDDAPMRPITQRAVSSMVLFPAADKPPRALPISSNLRLLRLNEAQSVPSNHEGAMAIERRSIPMERVSHEAAPRAASTVLLFQNAGERVALAVEEMIVIPGDLKVEFANGHAGALSPRGVPAAAIDILAPNILRIRRKRRRPVDASPRRKSILLIEPDAFLRDMIAQALIGRGFQVCARDGVLAARSAPPADLLVGVLIDVDAAAADGGAWVRKLRAGFGPVPAPPLFGLAAHAGPAMRRRASALGLTCLFGKFDRLGVFGALVLAEQPVTPEKAA